VTLAEFIALVERYHTPGHDVAVAANRAIEDDKRHVRRAVPPM